MRVRFHAAAAALAVSFAAACEAEAPARPTAPPGAAVTAAGVVDPGSVGLDDYLRCLSDREALVMAAHRGAPERDMGENTLAAFAATLAETPALIETDVRVTADGVPVLIHDGRLEDATTCDGEVAETTASELARCRVLDSYGRPTDASVPTLQAALDWADGRTVLELDVKVLRDMERVIETVIDADARNRVIVIAYSPRGAEIVHDIAPSLVVAAPVSSLRDFDELRRRNVRLSRVIAWTGDDDADLALFAELDEVNGVGAPSAYGAFSRRNPPDVDALAAAGLDILSTNEPARLWRDFSAADQTRVALDACAGR